MRKNMLIDTKLTHEEELLEQDLLKDVYVDDQSQDSKLMWKEAIANYQELSRTKQMTMRVDATDLIKVKVKAKAYSMPYQTLLKIVFKQFAEGKIEVKM